MRDRRSHTREVQELAGGSAGRCRCSLARSTGRGNVKFLITARHG